MSDLRYDELEEAYLASQHAVRKECQEKERAWSDVARLEAQREDDLDRIRVLEEALRECVAWMERNAPDHGDHQQGIYWDAALDMVADALAGGKNSRLYKRLVYDMQIAQDVAAYQASQTLSSYFLIQATARPGHTVEELKKVIDKEIEKLQTTTPDAHETERSINTIEATFFKRMERVGGFGGKAVDGLHLHDLGAHRLDDLPAAGAGAQAHGGGTGHHHPDGNLESGKHPGTE